MRQSKLLIHTYRETPRDADVVSQQLMMRAGMIQRVAAGIYDYLPLALRSIRKFEAKKINNAIGTIRVTKTFSPRRAVSSSSYFVCTRIWRTGEAALLAFAS